MAERTAVLNVVAVVDEEGHRVVSSVARCPICTQKFEDDEFAVVVSDLKKLATISIHNTCMQSALEAGPSEGVSEKKFERYRNRIIKGMRAS